mmetsp:Transcript_78872/g.115503  ORF Transcript_78872/g.115503 Transcript_78872/m.115503 type:complete len:102 (-) Transcript_78872:297-602(-)
MCTDTRVMSAEAHDSPRCRKITLTSVPVLHCSYNDEGIWAWNQHGSDWIYQGGPDSSDVKHDPQYNQWEDFDDSPSSWTITEPVDPMKVSPWLSAVGGGVY